MGAVLTHKLVVAFCLGAELASDGRSFASLNRCLMVYAVGSGIGIPFGIIIDRSRSSTTTSMTIPVLQVCCNFIKGDIIFLNYNFFTHENTSRVVVGI